MKTTFKIIAGIVVCFGVIACFIFLFVQSMPETKEVNEFDKKFELIQIGDPETKALSILGKPDAMEKEFRIGQENGFENAYARAKASDSRYYLIWFKGIDIVFTLGINENGRVSVKESGGT